MNRTLIALAVAAFTAANLFAAERISFDAGWRFLKSEAPGAEQSAFDDAAWRALDVPHEWSIEGPFDQKNPTSGAGAFLPSGVAWYRKHFTLPARAAQSHAPPSPAIGRKAMCAPPPAQRTSAASPGQHSPVGGASGGQPSASAAARGPREALAETSASSSAR